MNVAIDISPLSSGHSVRGVGFYLRHLKAALERLPSSKSYTFFTQETELEKDLDVIHYPYFDPFFLTLPARKKAKTVVTVHDLTPLVFPKAFPAGMKGKLRWLIQRHRLKQAEAVIADSAASKNDIIRLVGIPDENVHVVLLAAGEEFHKKDFTDGGTLKKKFALPDRFALYVGDVTWNKNLPRIIEAAGKAGVTLVLAGKALTDETYDRGNPWNKDRIRVDELSRENKNIIRVGFISSEDLVGLYHAATVLLMPSLYEGFGLPVIEAMTCSCPVITARRGSLPEVAGEAACYVEAENVDSIAEGIAKVFTDDAYREKLKKEGRKRSAHFSWEKAARETNEVYEKVYRSTKK